LRADDQARTGPVTPTVIAMFAGPASPRAPAGPGPTRSLHGGAGTDAVGDPAAPAPSGVRRRRPPRRDLRQPGGVAAVGESGSMGRGEGPACARPAGRARQPAVP